MNMDSFGDRIKSYEERFTSPRLDDGCFVARIDGRSFSKFTKNMKRPYDDAMSVAMINTTEKLMKMTHAVVAYTQSDEISLAFDNSSWFDGKIQKLSSVLAGMTSSAFMASLMGGPYEGLALDYLPQFDCRVFSVPDESELANSILWRIHDAKKNSISMAASAEYSHNALHNVNSVGKCEMLAERGIIFHQYPNFFKYGTMFYRDTEELYVQDEIWNRIPVHKRPETRSFVRSVIKTESEDLGYCEIRAMITKETANAS